VIGSDNQNTMTDGLSGLSVFFCVTWKSSFTSTILRKSCFTSIGGQVGARMRWPVELLAWRQHEATLAKERMQQVIAENVSAKGVTYIKVSHT